MAHHPSDTALSRVISNRRRFLGMAGAGAAVAGASTLMPAGPAGAVTADEVQAALTRAVGQDPFDHGATGDGVADDTTALQAAIDAAGAPGGVGIGAGVVVLGPATYRITDTLVMNRQAIRFVGHGIGNVTSYGPKAGNGTTIVWDGAAGGDMFDVTDSFFCEWSDIWFTSKNTKPAGAAISWRNPGSGSIGTNAQLQVNRCRIDYHPWSTGTNGAGSHFAYGVRVWGANANNDQFAIQDSVIAHCSVAAISVENSQSIWGHIFNTLVANSPKGIHMRADCTMYNLQFNSNDTDLHVEGNPTINVTGFHSEGAERPILLDGSSASGGKLSVRGGRIRLGSRWETAGAPPVFEAINFNGGLLSLDHVYLDRGGVTATPSIKARMHPASTTVATLAVRHCFGVSPSLIDAQAKSLNTANAYMLIDYDSRGDKVWTILRNGETFDPDSRPIDYADPGVNSQVTTPDYAVVADDADHTVIRYAPGTTIWPSDAQADIKLGTIIRQSGALGVITHVAGSGASVIGQTIQPPGDFITAIKWSANSWMIIGPRDPFLQNSQSGTAYTLSLNDIGSVVELTSSSPVTITVPNQSTVAWPAGDVCEIEARGSGTVSVVGASGVVIESLGASTSLAGQYAGARLRYRGSNTWHLTGQLA